MAILYKPELYAAKSDRYESGTMTYQRCGKSGVLLPKISLGMWHNFGSIDSFENQRDMIFKAFDLGITHFDLANNYGPAQGSAEENFGRILRTDLRQYRDELIISTKAGFPMWRGPYGNYGSRKHITASLDQSLLRLGLEYVDIFYHHRPDPETPLEETMGAISDSIKRGKVLYAGVSNYSSGQTESAAAILRQNGTPLLINQFRYNMLDRAAERDGLLDTLDTVGAGSITFSPLAQGLLSDKYIDGIPNDSRAARNFFLKKDSITAEKISVIKRLNEIASGRGQTLSQMALCWNLRKGRVTSVLIGAHNPAQIEENVKIIRNMDFSDDELSAIEDVLKDVSW